MSETHDILAGLSEGQKHCLKLVVLRKSSKEIARILNISKPTVDQRPARACTILGVNTRGDASLLYAQAVSEYDRVIYDPAYIAPIEQNVSPSLRQTNGLSAPHVLSESLTGALQNYHGLPHRIWTSERTWHELNSLSRLAVIAVLTIGILSAVLIGVAVGRSLSNILDQDISAAIPPHHLT